MNSNIFETLKKIKDQERKQPMHIYRDENTGQIIEEKLELDSAGSTLVTVNKAKLIHDFIFGNSLRVTPKT